MRPSLEPRVMVGSQGEVRAGHRKGWGRRGPSQTLKVKSQKLSLPKIYWPNDSLKLNLVNDQFSKFTIYQLTKTYSKDYLSYI